MSHMVIYRGADGKPGYHQTDDIHDAVMYVESLRNDKDVDHARIFRLEEVTFEYRPYYRVELRSGETVNVPATNGLSEANGSDADDVVETSEADDADDEVAADDGDADAEDSSDDVAEDADDDASDDDDEPVTGVRRGLFGR